MNKLAKKWLRIGEEEPVGEVDARLIGEHFGSICNTLREIRAFEGRWVHPMPTTRVFRRVNIEEAWPGCQEFIDWMFARLNEIAVEVEVEAVQYQADGGLAEAVDTFVETLNRAKFGLADAVGTGRYSLGELESIDQRLLALQHCANRLRKFVTEDFKYTPLPKG